MDCWLVNTGWVGGAYGIGKRISIKYTRALLNAALSGKLRDVEYATDPLFKFRIPRSCEEVPDAVLDPSTSWPDKSAYMNKYRELASRFIENFRKFEEGCPAEILQAGPKR